MCSAISFWLLCVAFGFHRSCSSFLCWSQKLIIYLCFLVLLLMSSCSIFVFLCFCICYRKMAVPLLTKKIVKKRLKKFKRPQSDRKISVKVSIYFYFAEIGYLFFLLFSSYLHYVVWTSVLFLLYACLDNASMEP